MTTTNTFTAHCEANMPGPEETAKQVERQRKAVRDLQRVNLDAQDARDKYAQAFRTPPAKLKPFKPFKPTIPMKPNPLTPPSPKPKPFKPVPPPRPVETIIRGLERKTFPKFAFETFRIYMAWTATEASSR